MSHKFSIPGIGGIIERKIDNIDHILVQCRCKDDALSEYGLIEIPAGKIREDENTGSFVGDHCFDCQGMPVEENEGYDILLNRL